MTTHANPDGDALGSALALAAGLRFLRKKVKIYNQDSVPANLKFLAGSESVTSELTSAEPFDAAFIVDCAEPERVGERFQNHSKRGKLIVLDHHKKSGRAGDLNYIDPEAASSGVVVWSLLRRLRVPLSRAIALNVYTTLVTDTGNFRYSNTTAEVLGLAKQMVEKGVSPWRVSREIYDNYPLPRLRLMSRVLASLQVSGDERYASIVITQKDFQETGGTADLVDEFINFPRCLKTVEVAIQFRETPEGKWKVSFRSKERVDVADLAGRFGGGGHARAAGCTLEGTFGEIQGKIFSAVEQVL